MPFNVFLVPISWNVCSFLFIVSSNINDTCLLIIHAKQIPICMVLPSLFFHETKKGMGWEGRLRCWANEIRHWRWIAACASCTKVFSRTGSLVAQPFSLVLTVRRLPRLLIKDCSGSPLPSGLLQWVILCQVPDAVLLIWSHCKPCDALWQLDFSPLLFEKNRNEQNRRGPRPLQVQLEAASTAMPYYSQRLTPSKHRDQGPKGPTQLLVTCCFFRIPSQSIIKWKQSKKNMGDTLFEAVDVAQLVEYLTRMQEKPWDWLAAPQLVTVSYTCNPGPGESRSPLGTQF